jgi:hypothetical protein
MNAQTAKTEYLLTLVRSLQADKGCTFDAAWRTVLAQSPSLMEGSVKGGFTKTVIPALQGSVTAKETKQAPVAPKPAAVVEAAGFGGVVDGCRHPFRFEAARRGQILINASEVDWVTVE